MVEEQLDENALFANFEDTTAVSAEIKMLRKHLGKEEKVIEERDNDTLSQKKYITELEEQNSKLKAIIKRMLGPQAFGVNENQPAEDEAGEIDLIKKLDDNIQSRPFAILLFLNNDMSTVHRKDIEEFMKDLSEKDARQDVLLAQKLQAQHSAVPLKSFSANHKGRRCNLPKSNDAEDPYIICSCQYYKSFYIDRMGAPLLECNPGSIDIWNIPTYEQVYLKALPIVEESLNIRVKQMRRCFNCDGDHNLAECPEPKDQQKINQNRAEFSASKANNSPAMVNDDELDDRFKHFKAGEISVGLEEALGISLETQLPPYIYKMRVLGYPPAYLKPVEEGLKMFGPDGETLSEPGAEEGEISGVKLPDVISYPGYNASMGEGVRDDSEGMGFPPFRPEEADLHIAMKRAQALGYIENAEPLAKRLKYDEVDMDVEDTTEAGKIELPHKKPKETPQDNTSKDTDEATNRKEGTEKKADKEDAKKTKEIDQTTYRHWYHHTPLTSGGITYVMYTPPPMPRSVVNILDLPKNPCTDLDREPWKTASISWYDPLYGDLVAPTGTYDAIRNLLKEKVVKRKPMA